MRRDTVIGASALLLLVVFVFFCFWSAYVSGVNRTECANLCLVRGFAESSPSGFTNGGDCQCLQRAYLITEGER